MTPLELIYLVLSITAAIVVWILYEFRHVLQPRKMWVVIFKTDEKLHWHFLKPDGNHFVVKGDKTKYTISPEAVYRTGRWNIPMVLYKYGSPSPINLKTMKHDSEWSDKDFHDSTETHVARDLLNSFNFSPQQMMTTFVVILAAIVVVTGYFVWWSLKKEIKSAAADRVERIIDAR